MQSVLVLKNLHIDFKQRILAGVFFIELFFLITPAYLTVIPSIAIIIRYSKVLWVALELFWLLLKGGGFRKKVPLIILASYSLLMLFSSFINRSEVMNTSINKAVSIILIILVMSRKSAEDFHLYSKVICMYGLSVLSFNLLTYFLFPNGLYRLVLHGGGGTLGGNAGYFLGIDNGFGAFIFPILMFAGYYSYLKKERIDMGFFTISILSLTTYIVTQSMTGLLALAGYIGLYCLLSISKTYKIVNYKILIGCFVFLTVFVVFLGGFAGMHNALTDFITNDLGKDMTFSGRTGIWERGIDQIRDALFFGYGAVKDGAYVRGIGTKYGAHNTVLQTLLESGLVSLIFLFSALLYYIKYVDKHSKNRKACALFHIGVFSTWIYYTFESANIVPLIGLISFIYASFSEDSMSYYFLRKNKVMR